MTDYELKDYKIGESTIESMTALTFLGWVAKKINGIEEQSYTRNELSLMVTRPPMGQMSLENKIEVIRKLEKLGITI